MQSGGMKIRFDNKKRYRKIVEKIMRSNMLAQEAGAEISMIKKLIGKIKFKVEIQLVKGHEDKIGQYNTNPLKHLIKEYDEKVRKM